MLQEQAKTDHTNVIIHILGLNIFAAIYKALGKKSSKKWALDNAHFPVVVEVLLHSLLFLKQLLYPLLNKNRCDTAAATCIIHYETFYNNYTH